MNVRPAPALAAFVLAALAPAALRAQFQPPVPAELTMTAAPEAPGAPALILFEEQKQEDNLHMWSYYYRVKVLTEGGKEQANVELPYFTGFYGVSIDSIYGRTIHPDGTIVPFTGKPYDKLIAKGQEQGEDYQKKAKVFSLPQVEIGSVLEYAYKLRFDDSVYLSPDWYIQGSMPIRKAHFVWRPTGAELINEDGSFVHAAWTPILPAGAKVTDKLTPNAGVDSHTSPETIELDIANVPPLPRESLMPPLDSVSYRVLFYYTNVRSSAEFWDRSGKTWSKARDKFIGPGNAVSAQAHALTVAADSPEKNLKKLYDFVESLENTDYTRNHSAQEDKTQGFGKLSSTEDVLMRKRGTSDQLTQLFVALARAAGIKAYLMQVANRDERVFLESYLSMRQLDDLIAVVPLDGKDAYFDPGERYCTFKHLAWKHSLTAGMRQQDGGKVALASTPAETYNAAKTSRIADLTLDEHGSATGIVTLTYLGDPALHWRHEALTGDETSLHHQLRRALENRLPGGMEIKVTDVDNLTDPDKPLIVKYKVEGAVGNATGKRLLLPASLFEINHKPEFNEARRELYVDMHYTESVQDAVRFKYPATLAIESVPPNATEKYSDAAAFSTSARQAPNAITLYRNYVMNKVYVTPAEYPDFRTFYGKLESTQAGSLILTRAPAAATGPGSN